MNKSQKSQNPVLSKSLDLFVPSTRIIRDNIGTFFILNILPYLILSGVFAFQIGIHITPATSTSVEKISFASGFWWLITAYLLYVLVCYGPLVYTYNKTAAGNAVGLREAFRNDLPFIWRLAVLSVYSSLLIIAGFLLIIPGFIMLRRYYLAPFYLVDRNLEVGEAMRQSAAESKQFSRSIYGLFGVGLMIAMLGLVPLFGTYLSSIGQLLYSVAPALRYREINAVKRP